MWSNLVSNLAVKGKKEKKGNLKICFLFMKEEV